jgi:NAD(P)-dependent dehydrogenase (short-subunit alcohol dehydrogenase family)
MLLALKMYMLRQMHRSTDQIGANVRGRVVIITGSNTGNLSHRLKLQRSVRVNMLMVTIGIGRVTAMILAQHGNSFATILTYSLSTC